MSLQGKTIVITGVSSGIGSDTAKLLRLQGARVIGMDRNDPMLTLDGFVKADLSTPEAIDAAGAQLPARIDALCNLAGGFRMGEAVHEVLQQMVGEAGLAQLKQQGRYRRDLY